MGNLLLGGLLGLLLTATPDADSPAVTAAANQLLTSASVLPAETLIIRIQQLAADQRLTPATRRQALHQFLIGLRQQPESPPARAAVLAVADLPIPGLEPHPENPAVDHDPAGLVATAQGTLNAWQYQQWQGRATADIQRGSLDFVKHLDGADWPAIAGSANAIRQSGSAIDGVRLADALEADPRLTPLAAAGFATLGTPVLLDIVVRHGDAAAASRLLAGLDAWLDPDEALVLWKRYLSEPQLAPVVIAGLARIQTPAAFALLANLLGDEQLAVAAEYGLARYTQPWARSELEKLQSHPDRTISRRVSNLLARTGDKP